MDRSTTVLFNELEDDKKPPTQQDFALSMVRHFSRKEKARKLHSSTSILRRSISDSVERNLSCRIGLHQVTTLSLY